MVVALDTGAGILCVVSCVQCNAEHCLPPDEKNPLSLTFYRNFFTRYPYSSIDTIAPVAIKASMEGSAFKRMRVIISGLASVTRKEITLGLSSPP